MLKPTQFYTLYCNTQNPIFFFCFAICPLQYPSPCLLINSLWDIALMH